MTERIPAPPRRPSRRFWPDRSGNVALIFAALLPMVAVIAAAGVELAFLYADKSKMQDVADSSALAGAKELTLAMQEGASKRSELFAESQLVALRKRSKVEVTSAIVKDGAAIEVTINSSRPSFFGNLLPPGGFKTHVTAVAERMGRIPLCVLSSSVSASSGIELTAQSKLTAGKCMVHSNTTIEVDDSAWLRASAIKAVGDARGRISPEAQVGGEAIDDPFATMAVTVPKTCSLLGDLLLNLGISATPGVHCGNIIVHKGQTLNLAPGEHYFRDGKLELKEDAKLVGHNVVMIFDKSSSLSLKDNAALDLEGRTTGRYAGFVIITTHDNDQTFEISTDSARNLLGTVYIPNATLQVSGSASKIADQSPWTVIVAKTVKMIGSPDLVINANYASSSVPVPQGVGPTYADARLAQ